VDRSGPGFLPHPIWTVQCGPPPANTAKGIGSHCVSGHELEITDGSLGIADFDGGWDIVNFEPSLTLTTFNNGQTIDSFDGIPGTNIFSNGLRIVGFGVLNENPTISNFDRRLSGNIGGSLGVKSFGGRLENLTSHETLGLENPDPSLDIATSDFGLAIPNFDDSLHIASFDENHDRLNHLR
jgi:hypothetical protein